MSPIERSSGGGGGFSNPMTTAGDIIIENAVPAPARLGIGTSGQVLGISGGLPAWVTPPGFEFGYDQITASVTVTSTIEATGTTVITCAAHTFDGAPVMAEFYSPVVSVASGAGAFVAVSLFEGATQLGEFGTCEQPASAAATFQQAMFAAFRFTPTAAAHTYTVTAFKNAAPNCVVQAGAGGTGANMPAFIRFTKV